MRCLSFQSQLQSRPYFILYFSIGVSLSVPCKEMADKVLCSISLVTKEDEGLAGKSPATA